MNPDKFYVIAVCSNPCRYENRYKLFHQFKRDIEYQGAKLLVVEQAFGDRPFEVTERDNLMHLQFRSSQELWMKERMVNLGINYLSQIDPDWEYVAWCDADIVFQRNDIVMETMQQLQHFQIVQMFAQCVDTGPNGEYIQTHNGFAYMYYLNNYEPPANPGYGNNYGVTPKGAFWHPGYAWAARRSFIEKVGLIDRAILGAGDHHMSLSLIGAGRFSLPAGITTNYWNMVMQWQELAGIHGRRSVGFVPGLITHAWHGAKRDRKYIERWDILVSNAYDPYWDISTDGQGLYQLNDFFDERSMRLRDDIRLYFRQRNEDSNSL